MNKYRLIEKMVNAGWAVSQERDKNLLQGRVRLIRCTWRGLDLFIREDNRKAMLVFWTSPLSHAAVYFPADDAIGLTPDEALAIATDTQKRLDRIESDMHRGASMLCLN